MAGTRKDWAGCRWHLKICWASGAPSAAAAALGAALALVLRPVAHLRQHSRGGGCTGCCMEHEAQRMDRHSRFAAPVDCRAAHPQSQAHLAFTGAVCGPRGVRGNELDRAGNTVHIRCLGALHCSLLPAGCPHVAATCKACTSSHLLTLTHMQPACNARSGAAPAHTCRSRSRPSALPSWPAAPGMSRRHWPPPAQQRLAH